MIQILQDVVSQRHELMRLSLGEWQRIAPLPMSAMSSTGKKGSNIAAQESHMCHLHELYAS